MTQRATIIQNCMDQWQPRDGDLISYVNGILVDEGQHQLNCCERRDVVDNRPTTTGELSCISATFCQREGRANGVAGFADSLW